MGEKWRWYLSIARVGDVIPEWDVNLGTASEAPPSVLHMGMRTPHHILMQLLTPREATGTKRALVTSCLGGSS